VYCGEVFDSEELTVDHVQPRVKRGDQSRGNVVTACRACNTRKGSRSLVAFLAAEPNTRSNFFRYATTVWARHLRALEQGMKEIDVANSDMGSIQRRD
jgi:5-methylcytosine-specific restriction endonuclease McrA